MEENQRVELARQYANDIEEFFKSRQADKALSTTACIVFIIKCLIDCGLPKEKIYKFFQEEIVNMIKLSDYSETEAR